MLPDEPVLVLEPEPVEPLVELVDPALVPVVPLPEPAPAEEEESLVVFAAGVVVQLGVPVTVLAAVVVPVEALAPLPPAVVPLAVVPVAVETLTAVPLVEQIEPADADSVDVEVPGAVAPLTGSKAPVDTPLSVPVPVDAVLVGGFVGAMPPVPDGGDLWCLCLTVGWCVSPAAPAFCVTASADCASAAVAALSCAGAYDAAETCGPGALKCGLRLATMWTLAW